MSVSDKANEGFGTFIDSDTRISGDIEFAGSVLMDGNLEGNVKAKGSDAKLTISEHGHVKGTVDVAHLLVHGTIEGELRVTERLELGPKARIIGDVQYNLLQISDGAQVEGELIHESEAGIKDKKARVELSVGNAAPSDTVLTHDHTDYLDEPF